MPNFLSPLETESELQWDVDSEQKAVNCGPSSAEKVANYFKNLLHYGIERTRNLGTNRRGTGTNTTEQKKMLDERGVPSEVLALTPQQIKDRLKSGRRPMIVWLKMSLIPDAIAGHNFQGDHAVTFLANGIVNGKTGVWVNEPNQRRDRPAYKKNRFYPDDVWSPASSAIGRWCIVPTKDKVIATRTPLKKKWVVNPAVLNIRTAPTGSAADVGNLGRGDTFTSNLIETQGGRYPYAGTIHDEWLGFIRNNKQRWVAKAYCKEA